VKAIRGKGEVEMEGFSPTDLEEGDRLLKETEELEEEIEEIKKRIPPHSARCEIFQLLEQKEHELERKKTLLSQERRPD
jgi:hypothetical protein